MPTTAPFPQPGSTAMLDGIPVTVHQLIDAETALVFGERVQRRARLAELAPPPERSLLDQWLDERVAPSRDYDTFTPASDAADDFRAWLAASGHAESAPPSDRIFMRAMHDAGWHPTRGLWRAVGDTQSRHRTLFRFVLRRT